MTWEGRGEERRGGESEVFLQGFTNLVTFFFFPYFFSRFLCEPKDRLLRNGLTSVMAHPFFDGVDWSRLRTRVPPFIPKVIPTSLRSSCVLERI